MYVYRYTLNTVGGGFALRWNSVHMVKQQGCVWQQVKFSIERLKLVYHWAVTLGLTQNYEQVLLGFKIWTQLANSIKYSKVKTLGCGAVVQSVVLQQHMLAVNRQAFFLTLCLDVCHHRSQSSRAKHNPWHQSGTRMHTKYQTTDKDTHGHRIPLTCMQCSIIT